MSQNNAPKRKRYAAAMLVGGVTSSLATAFVTGKLIEGPLKRPTRTFDRRISHALCAAANPALDQMMKLLSAAGEPFTLYPLTGFAALRWLTQKREKDALITAVAIGGSAAMNGALKRVVKRSRPIIVFRKQAASSSSFPSDHVTMSLAAYGTLVYVMVRAKKEKKRRFAVRLWATVLALSVMIGWSRVYMKVHRPSDIVGGWIVGGMWLASCCLARDAMESEKAEE
ncbi:MAG: phosphatase PAP2 family protein [Chloroflexi bacterium]|nr:phosphatase PAP2 family protein [Chloroflexota bacterium]